MQTSYNADINRNRRSGGNGSSFVRIGLIFGSLVVALGLMLIPVYMQRSSNGLMDTQYSQSQAGQERHNAEAAYGAGDDAAR